MSAMVEGRRLRAADRPPAPRQQSDGAFIAKSTWDDLHVLGELATARALRPVQDRTNPLNRAGEAIGYLETGHARGKVVVTI